MTAAHYATTLAAGIALLFVSFRGMPPIPKPKWSDFAPAGCVIAFALIFISALGLMNWALS